MATITLSDIDKIYDNGFQAVTGFRLNEEPKQWSIGRIAGKRA